MDQTQIDQLFKFHPPSRTAIATAHGNVRDAMKQAATTLLAECPACAERTLAIRHCQQAMFFANAAIAIHQRTGHDEVVGAAASAG